MRFFQNSTKWMYAFVRLLKWMLLTSKISKQKTRVLEHSKKVEAILVNHPALDPDTVRHTLILLELEPEERLRRALLRGQTFNYGPR